MRSDAAEVLGTGPHGPIFSVNPVTIPVMTACCGQSTYKWNCPIILLGVLNIYAT